MSLPPSGAGSLAGTPDALAFAHKLVDLGVPVWPTPLADGRPMRQWKDIAASHPEVDRWRPGQALCARTGIAFDVLDVDPRHGGSGSYRALRSRLGRDPDIYCKVRTRSGGLHLYVPPLGLGTHHPVLPQWPGLDLQGLGAMVFIPPTVRLGGQYTVSADSLSDLASASVDAELAHILSTEIASSVEVPGSGRQDTDTLRAALLSAPDGQQRAALLRYTAELEYRYEREDVRHILLSLLPVLPSYDKRCPWNERTILSGLHRPGSVIPDSRGEDLDFDSPDPDSGVGPLQRKANAVALRSERARLYVREVLSAESGAGLDLSGTGLTLAADMALGVPSVVWAVDSLATMGAQVTLPSSRKTGKTTFLLNLARSAGNGTPFLDSFECTLDGAVGYINAEMLRADILGYCSRLDGGGGGVWLDRVRMMHCRESGVRLNLMSDSVVEKLIGWLVSGGCEWLFLDPWKNFLSWAGAGMNDNDAVLLLSDRIRALCVAAHITLCVIPMHTTQAQGDGDTESGERGKGAGELEDGADWLWRYTRIPGSDVRSLSSVGRGPGVSGMVIGWDSASGSLFHDTGSRASVRRDEGAASVVEALTLILLDGRAPARVKHSELYASLHGTKTTRNSAIRSAVSLRMINVDNEGVGRATWYSLV